MDLVALRSTMREIQFGTHGVPATVTVPGEDPVNTTIIWLTPAQEERPANADFPRRDVRRAMALRRDEVPALPRGTTVEVTEHLQGTASTWVVDSMDALFQDHHRVTVRLQA